jgi:hypothetical protein
VTSEDGESLEGGSFRVEAPEAGGIILRSGCQPVTGPVYIKTDDNIFVAFQMLNVSAEELFALSRWTVL